LTIHTVVRSHIKRDKDLKLPLWKNIRYTWEKKGRRSILFEEKYNYKSNKKVITSTNGRSIHSSAKGLFLWDGAPCIKFYDITISLQYKRVDAFVLERDCDVIELCLRNNSVMEAMEEATLWNLSVFYK
jgi:hypothetical protein